MPRGTSDATEKVHDSVLSLLLASVPARADVRTLCSGRGIAFRLPRTSTRPRPVTKCKGKRKHRKCTNHPPGTHSVNLTGLFAKHRLRLGTTLTVEIIQTNVVGKAYEFKGPEVPASPRCPDRLPCPRVKDTGPGLLIDRT